MNKKDIFKNNLEAIKTLKGVESRNGLATKEEKEIMTKFQGFGGCSQAFYRNTDMTGATKGWEIEAKDLSDALTDKEYKDARESVLNAFFTPRAVVDNMFGFLPRVGNKKLEIFEPGCGVGNFLSLMPDDFRFNTYTGLEKDNVSARIATAIYKENSNITIINQDFSKDISKKKYDLIIGNPPFGDSKINGKSIHNFFIEKSINMLKPGGILTFVITHSFLDSLNPESRFNVFKKANLLVADRLDDDAFSYLNTDVNTDVVMFQRLTAAEEEHRGALIEFFPELEKGNIPKPLNSDLLEYVNWIKSESPEGQTENTEARIAPINFGFSSNSSLFLSNGVFDATTNRFGKPIMKMFSYDNYRKTGLKDDKSINEISLANSQAKEAFKGGSGSKINFFNFEKNLGVVIDGDQDVDISKNNEESGVLVDSFEVNGVGVDGIAEYERLKNNNYQTKLPSGSFLTLNSMLVSDEALSNLELASQESGSSIFKTNIVVTPINDAGGVTTGNNYAFYVDSYTPLKKKDNKEVLDTKKLEIIQHYVELRDTITKLLDADSAGESSEDLRVKLNQSYDDYVKRFGFLNNQNLKRAFIEDPLVYRVLSLEKDYDKGVSAAASKSSGEDQRKESALKVDLFSKNVIAPVELQDMSNADMKDLLNYSLSYNCSFDIRFMVQVSGKPVNEIINSLLADQSIFFDPEKFDYVASNVYLSGDIRDKIEFLKRSSLSEITTDNYGLEIDTSHNLKALTDTLPEEVKIYDIDPQLGEGWIPAHIIREFACTKIFPKINNPKNFSIEFIPENGKWALGTNNYLGFSDFDTDHKRAIDILGAVLNNKSVIIKNTIENEYGTEVKVVNQVATAIAQEKSNLMKALFEQFIIDNPDYIDELEMTYNESFNRFAALKNKVGKLALPGKVSDDVIELRPTQESAIYRIINNKSTLLDHTVGLGKTFTMVAAAMELKRIGVSKKPLLVVPNHIIDDFAKAFVTLYPKSDILVPPQGGLNKKNRLLFFERMRMLNVDAIIIGHSAFKHLQVSQQTQQEIYSDMVQDMDSAISKMNDIEGIDRRAVAQQIQQRDRLEQKLEGLLSNTGDKDHEASTIESIGIDSIFVDEAHLFKNLGFPTSMSRIAGLGSTSGSQMAMDLFLKIQHINKIGGRVVFATGTPISNSMAELYTMQRYLSLDSLNKMGVSHFDAWQGVFAKVTSEWELAPTGMDYRLVSRFSKFLKVPELMAMYQGFADVVTKKDLEEALKEIGQEILIPVVNGGKPANIIVNKNSHIEGYMIDIVERATNLPPDPSEDNMLKVMNDARKVALDFRLIEPLSNVDEEEGSKLAEVSENLIDIYHRYNDVRGVQLVFIDLSTPNSAKDDRSFNAYDDIKERLLRAGIPANEVAYIHHATTDQKKADLYTKVRGGSVRVLLGTTAKMGAGMNVQDRLVALHHIDAPWRPSDIEQREGRILRQGNIFYQQDPEKFQPHILRYATEETLDSRMWQTIENKALFIEQFRSGDIKGRTMSEINTEAMSSAEMKAASSGNPLVLEEIQLKSNIQKLERLKKSSLAAKASQESKISRLGILIQKLPQYIKGLEGVISDLKANPKQIDPKSESSKDKDNEEKTKKKNKVNHNIKVYGGSASEFTTYPDYISAANAIQKNIISRSEDGASINYPLFNYRGIDFDFEVNNQNALGSKHSLFTSLQKKSLRVSTATDIGQEIIFASETINPTGFFTRVNIFLKNMDYYLPEYMDDLKSSKAELDFLENNSSKNELFNTEQQEELLSLKNQHDSVLTELQNSENQEGAEEKNYIANVKFIRTSENSVDVFVFSPDCAEYTKKTTIVKSKSNDGWLLEGNKFECLYQAKLKAHHLFNEKYKDIESTGYDFNDVDFKEIDDNDGIVFDGEATEELCGGDDGSYFSSALGSDSSNGLLFIDPNNRKEKSEQEKIKVNSTKLQSWLSL